jgi:microcompartment protein CcmL/EutN
MLEPAIALVETNSIAAGILSGDTMVKKAIVQLLEAPTCTARSFRH